MVISDLTISLIVLTGVRGMAFIMFLFIFFQRGNRTHLVLSLSWLLYMSGPMSALIRGSSPGMLVSPLFGFSAAASTYLLMLTILLYARDIKTHVFNILVFAVVPAIAAAFLLPGSAGLITTSFQGFFLAVMLLLVVFGRKIFPGNRLSASFFWLCVTLGLGLLHAVNFMFDIGSGSVSVKLLYTFFINISLLEFFIYLDWEWAFSSLEKSDKRYRFLFDAAPVAIFEGNAADARRILSEMKSGRVGNVKKYYRKNPDELKRLFKGMEVLEVNRKTMELFEAGSREQLISILEQSFLENIDMILPGLLSEDVLEEEGHSFEASIKTATGNSREVIISLKYSDDKPAEGNALFSIIDITEKNEIQKSIENSLREKEVLLQEVHHRVKNNLAILSSIINLQKDKDEFEGNRRIFRGIENRINTMAAVHEQLYLGSELREIDLENLIRSLAVNISSTETRNKPVDIRINIETDASGLSMNIMVPLGMLINEVLSNAFIHAFEDAETPEICITLSEGSNRSYILSISDNGSGMNIEDSQAGISTTGLIIIEALVQQLRAKHEIINDNGTVYRIFIPGDSF